jgi:hypothetical protein
MENSRISWPSWQSLSPTFKASYKTIDRDVYETAGSIWPQALSLARRTNLDESFAFSVMMAAVESVSRTATGEIDSLAGYLFVTFKRQLFAEARKIQSSASAVAVAGDVIDDAARGIERNILLEEIVAHMDDETLKIYEKLILGYTFEEIARQQHQQSNLIRSKFNKRIKKIATKLNQGPVNIKI